MIDIQLDIGFLKDSIDPEISVLIDQKVILSGPQCQHRVNLNFRRTLSEGDHRLEVQYHNMQRLSENHSDMAVLIERVGFQSLEHDFKTYGRYIPHYPENWLQEQMWSGLAPPREICSTYLGWNGTWYLDFQTPIYQWAHRRINLGWLI